LGATTAVTASSNEIPCLVRFVAALGIVPFEVAVDDGRHGGGMCLNTYPGKSAAPGDPRSAWNRSCDSDRVVPGHDP
jgi:hypothetical protein